MGRPLKLIGILAVGLGTIALIGFFGFYAFLAGPLSFDCSNEIVAEYPSPDSTSKVVVFQRDCGATTGFSTQASVLPAEAELAGEAGNIFVADTNHGEATTASWGGPNLEVRWDSPDTIILTHDQRARVTRSFRRVGLTTIRYVVTQ